MNKKLVINLVALFVLMLGALGSGYAQSQSPACNNKLIAGNYGFRLEGNKLGGQGPTGPQVGVAMTEFDGNGGLTQIDTVTVDGIVVADFSHSPATGTYTSELFRLHRHLHNQLHRRPTAHHHKFRCCGRWFGNRHRSDQCGWKPGNSCNRQHWEKAVFQTLTSHSLIEGTGIVRLRKDEPRTPFRRPAALEASQRGIMIVFVWRRSKYGSADIRPKHRWGSNSRSLGNPEAAAQKTV